MNTLRHELFGLLATRLKLCHPWNGEARGSASGSSRSASDTKRLCASVQSWIKSKNIGQTLTKYSIST